MTSRALHQHSDITSPLTLRSSHLSLLLLLRHSKPAPASGPLHLPTSLPSSALLPCLTPWLICWFQVLTSVLVFQGGLFCSLSLNCTPPDPAHTHTHTTYFLSPFHDLFSLFRKKKKASFISWIFSVSPTRMWALVGENFCAFCFLLLILITAKEIREYPAHLHSRRSRI